MKPFGLLAALTVLLLGACLRDVEQTRHNIVLIMADDLGVETVGADGGTSYATPGIDRLAAEGVRFENAHAQPLCTPSRVKIMMGQYNFRDYEHFAYLRPGSETFARALKGAGYRTLVAGKWQLVRSSRAGPEIKGLDPVAAGFHEYFVWQLEPGTRGNRYWNPTFADNSGLQDYPDTAFGPDLINARVREFMAREDDRPFFIYYPMVLPHAPFVPTPDRPGLQDTQEKFAAMVNYMDTLVGKVRQQAVELGIEDRTVIIFAGDNGTDSRITSRRHGGDVVGGKGKTLDRGTHVPFIIWGAAVEEGGRGINELVSFNDVLPTLVELR